MNPTTTLTTSARPWNEARTKRTAIPKQRYCLVVILLGLLLSTLFVSIGIHNALSWSDEAGIVSVGINHHPSTQGGRRLMGPDPNPQQHNESSAKYQNAALEEDDEEDEIIEIIHIIYTRMFQFQPKLLDLGLARLAVFRTFCLPTMVHQTSQNFLWIIYTDPDLHPELKRALTDMIAPYENFILVANNIFPSNFRKTAPLFLFDTSKVWSGDISLAKLGYDASLRWPVIETRLDGDDGLHNYFVEFLQRDAVLSLAAQCTGSSKASLWKMWCSYTSIEWQPHNPFPPLINSTAARMAAANNGSFGYVVGVATPHCQTPGLTTGYCPDVGFEEVPKSPHHKLLESVAECPEDDFLSIECVKRLKSLSPASIRARTITSHGMMNVMVNEGDPPKNVYKLVSNQMQKQAVLWEGIEEFIHIKRDAALSTRNYILSHQKAIASDNLKGQCTKSHSCKDSTKKILETIAKDDGNPPHLGFYV